MSGAADRPGVELALATLAFTVCFYAWALLGPLGPDIQEALLFLPAVDDGRDPVKEWQVRPVAAEPVKARTSCGPRRR